MGRRARRRPAAERWPTQRAPGASRGRGGRTGGGSGKRTSAQCLGRPKAGGGWGQLLGTRAGGAQLHNRRLMGSRRAGLRKNGPRHPHEVDEGASSSLPKLRQFLTVQVFSEFRKTSSFRGRGLGVPQRDPSRRAMLAAPISVQIRALRGLALGRPKSAQIGPNLISLDQKWSNYCQASANHWSRLAKAGEKLAINLTMLAKSGPNLTNIGQV